MEQEQITVEEDEEQQQEIWSWGAGTDGQLATGRLQDEHTPRFIRSLSVYGPIVSLSCGGAHVIALTPGTLLSLSLSPSLSHLCVLRVLVILDWGAGGRVLTWGRGTSGQLGHGDSVSNLQAKIVKELEGFVITHVSAGWNHSGFVSGFHIFPLCSLTVFFS